MQSALEMAGPLPDRRRRPTPMLSRYWLRGRRRGDPGHVGIYVDRYSARDWALVAIVLGLQIVDCSFTLFWIERGATEANPVMAEVLQRSGTGGFVAAKVSIALLASTFLLLHIRFRWVRIALWSVAVLYVVVAAWHTAGFGLV